MLKLNRKSEYALMVVQRLGGLPEGTRLPVTTLAERGDLPRDLLAKVLQDLKHAAIVDSTKGVSGGYSLARPLDQIRFVDVIRPFEDNLGLVDCVGETNTSCARLDCCTLHDPIEQLNNWLMSQLSGLTMAEFITARPPAPCGGRVQLQRRGGSASMISTTPAVETSSASAAPGSVAVATPLSVPAALSE